MIAREISRNKYPQKAEISSKEILGHSSITLTANLYIHVGDHLKREAADAMDAIFQSAANAK